MDVLRGRRGHLETLNAGRSHVREEHCDFNARNVPKARHCGRTRIPGGRSENEHLAPVGKLLCGGRHQYGKNRKRDILERAGRTLEKLKDLEAVGFDERNRILCREFRKKVSDRIFANFRRNVVEDSSECKTLRVRKALYGRNCRRIKRLHALWNVKTPIWRKAAQHGIERICLNIGTSAGEFHFGKASLENLETLWCDQPISARIVNAAATGSSAARMGRPTTRCVAPSRTASAGVATRF